MSKLDLNAINDTVKGLPQAALALMPDDRPLRFLTGHIPIPVTEENAQLALDVCALICRRVAVLFNNLAQEMEEKDLSK